VTNPKDAPTPPAQVGFAPIGLWLIATSTVFALGVATHTGTVRPTTFAWRDVPAQEAEEVPAATSPTADAVATAAADVRPPLPTSPATEPPVPPVVAGTDAPGVDACALAAERLAFTTSYEAAMSAFVLCMPGAGRPETLRDMDWRYAKLLADGYREAEARRLFEGVVLSAPDVPQSHNHLAWHLLTTSEYRSAQQVSADRARALTAAEEAVRLSHRRDNAILNTLAEALLQIGRRDDALLVLEEITTLTRRPIHPARLEEFIAGKSRFMLTHEYSEEHSRGRAWTPEVERLSEVATHVELGDDEVRALSPVERSTLRNAIFARRGQRPHVRWLYDIFTQRPWYRAKPAFNAEEDMLPLDLRNIAIIRAIEAGLPVPAADSRANLE